MKSHQLLFLCALICLAPWVSQRIGVAMAVCYFGLALMAWFCGKDEKK